MTAALETVPSSTVELNTLFQYRSTVWCNYYTFCLNNRYFLPTLLSPSSLELQEEEFTTDSTANTLKPRVLMNHLHLLCRPKGGVFRADWDNGIDDTYILEATEDAELAKLQRTVFISIMGWMKFLMNY